MKNLNNYIQESLRIGINDRPQVDIDNTKELFGVYMIFNHANPKESVYDFGITQNCKLTKNSGDIYELNGDSIHGDSKYVDFEIQEVDNFLCSVPKGENNVYRTSCFNIFMTSDMLDEFKTFLDNVGPDIKLRTDKICNIIGFDINNVPELYRNVYYKYDNDQSYRYDNVFNYVNKL